MIFYLRELNLLVLISAVDEVENDAHVTTRLGEVWVKLEKLQKLEFVGWL